MSLETLLNRFYKKTDPVLVKLFSTTGFLSGVYYLLFSKRFRREHQSVLKGRLAYHEAIKVGGSSSATLRRNVHRLEKGLIMRPRRKVFAEAYIGETVDVFERMLNSRQSSTREIKWAFDVLNDYFGHVSDTAEIEKARQIFSAACRLTMPADVDVERTEKYKPYHYENIKRSTVSCEQLEILFRQRRSVRWYKDEPVDISMIYHAIDVASLAPSACNRQPFSFLISSGKSQAEAIAACAGGTAGFSSNLQSVAVLVGDLGCYFHERDRHLIYIDSSLAAMQFMLALETKGLSSCPINWPDVEKAERKIRKIIDLPQHKKIIMLIAIGYADYEGGIAYSQKKTSKDIARVIA